MFSKLAQRIKTIYKRASAVRVLKDVYTFLESQITDKTELMCPTSNSELQCMVIPTSKHACMIVDVDKETGLISCWMHSWLRDNSIYCRLMTMDQFEEYFNNSVIQFDVVHNDERMFKISERIRRLHDS